MVFGPFEEETVFHIGFEMKKLAHSLSSHIVLPFQICKFVPKARFSWKQFYRTGVCGFHFGRRVPQPLHCSRQFSPRPGVPCSGSFHPDDSLQQLFGFF